MRSWGARILLFFCIDIEIYIGVVNETTIFEYSFGNDRALNWIKEIDHGWLHGFWMYDWADNYVKLSKIDTTNKLIYVNTTTPPVYGFAAKARYLGVNFLSELDTIDEYFIDRKNKLIYISKLRESTLSTDKYYLSINPRIITGNNEFNSTHDKLRSRHQRTRMQLQNKKNKTNKTNKRKSTLSSEGISFVSIQNVSIYYSTDTAISFENVTNSNIFLLNIDIMNHGCHGIIMNSLNSIISQCNITFVGCSGMIIGGINDNTLTPGNNILLSNNVSYFAQWKRTMQPGIYYGGVNNSFINNFFGYAPQHGMLGGGNNLLIQYNKFYRLCIATSDSGAWYSGRSWVHRGSIIDSNIFENIYQLENIVLGAASVQGVYLDDQISGNNITNNIFIQCYSGILVGGGRRNLISKNYFAKCGNDILFDDRGLTWQTEFCQKNGTFEKELIIVNYTYPPWSSEYPYLPNIMNQQPCTPVFNQFINNKYCCNQDNNIFNTCSFISQSNETIQSWNSTIYGNNQTNWNKEYCTQ